jgi:hypothetical protein
MRNTSRLRLLLVPLVAVVAAATATTGAAAAPPTRVSGTVGNTSATFESIRAAGDNLIIELSATASYTGALVGTSTIKGTLIVHADGSASYHDVEVFTGTLNGVSGTITFNLNGYNDFDLAVHATATILDATGGLAGLHGVLHEVQTVVLPTGPVGTYSGSIG